MSRPRRRRSGPRLASTGRPPEHSTAADEAESTVTDLATWRECRAWHAAVLWLHGLGLPAAVPCGAREWLRARGVEADWYYRGPCGCGSGGCWVLVADGEDPPPEIHAPASAR
jgi:hypothetical protein